MKEKRLFATLTLGLGLTLALLRILGSQSLSAVAAPSAGHVEAPNAPAAELHVCPSGCAYSSVQAAVDAAGDGDVIKVATGDYTDIHAREGMTQVVYISKSVTIRGGYTAPDFTDPPDPEANPTTLDAQRQGRVLYITGNISPTIEGLRITDGDATGLGGAPWGDTGGGVYVYMATATIRNCVVYSNTASTDNYGYGGGLYLDDSPATLSGNKVQGNTASTGDEGFGGGLYNRGKYLTTLSGNTFVSNTASTVSNGHGGGLLSGFGLATLSGNTVISNTAALSPIATGQGGGVYVFGGSIFFTNNLVVDNHANTQGSGLWFGGYSSEYSALGYLLHTSIASNRGSGQGVYVDDYTTLAFTNTIIVDHHSVGITITTGSTATLEATLWGDGDWANGDDRSGGGVIFTGTVNYWGDPAFVNPDTGDYHIGPTSKAIDAGVNAGIIVDVDGESRPAGNGYDIGADEFWWKVYLPLVLRQ